MRFARNPRLPRLLIASLAAIALGSVALAGRQPAVPALTSIEVMIPMRDGTRLFTQIYTPERVTTSLPIVFQRTPYGVGRNTPAAVAEALVDLPAVGYIIVLQDIRGRFKSEGSFVMLRQPRPSMNSGRPELVEGRDRTDPKAIDESTDTYDTIEWLVKNLANNNGRVGIWGISFPGHYTAQAIIDAHPALKCASPQAPMADNWIGDDMHHNGAFFLPHAFNFIADFGWHRFERVPVTGS